ncbi:MAG: thioredoxin family protein [Candidatus Hadarchaeales archaeon]
MIIIEILGTGDAKCRRVEDNCRKALEELGVKGKVVPVYDVDEMVKRKITTSPAVLINGKLVSSGSVPSIQEIKSWLRK